MDSFLAAILYRESRPRHFRFDARMLVAYLVVVGLHVLWDGLPSVMSLLNLPVLSYSVAEAGTAAIGLLILWGSVEGFIGYILLGGVALSMTLVVVGVGWHWLATGKLGVSYLIKGVNLLWFLSAIAQGTSSRAARRDPLVNLGIGVLMLTPYMRVLGSALFFAFMARNWKYTVSPPLSSAC